MKKHYEAVVIGTSAGGLFALSAILDKIPAGYAIPVIIVQHRSKNENTLMEEVLQTKCNIKVKQADEKEPVMGGMVYIAPPGYHLLIEHDRTFSLSCDAPVHYSRPSIDVLFETASYVYRDKLAAIILTGANRDGAAGIASVRKYDGTTIAQNPETAAYPFMPQSAINTGKVQYVYDLNEIINFLLNISKPIQRDV